MVAKENDGEDPAEGGNHDPRSPAPRVEAVNILLIGGNRLLQESVIQLLENTRFSVIKCFENLDHATVCLGRDPDGFDMLIFQLVDYNDAHFFERLAEVKRTEADLRIVLLAWPIKGLTFLTHYYEVGVDAYLESTTSQEGFRQPLDCVVSGERIFPTRLKESTVTAADRKDSEKSPAPSSLS